MPQSGAETSNNSIHFSYRDGKATMVTGHIETFTETGIEMKTGEKVEADFIISATGLTMQGNFPFSTIKVSIDGEAYNAPDHMVYNSVMLNDVPNFAFVVGYTNASWTLKADISAVFITKLGRYSVLLLDFKCNNNNSKGAKFIVKLVL